MTPSARSRFSELASARTRRSGSLMPLRAQIRRCAQAASMASLTAVLSRPRRRNGPTCSRGSGASSRMIGSTGAACATMVVLSSKRMAEFDFPVDLVIQVLNHAALFFGGHQLQALVVDAAELEKLILQIASNFAYGPP